MCSASAAADAAFLSLFVLDSLTAEELLASQLIKDKLRVVHSHTRACPQEFTAQAARIPTSVFNPETSALQK